MVDAHLNLSTSTAEDLVNNTKTFAQSAEKAAEEFHQGMQSVETFLTREVESSFITSGKGDLIRGLKAALQQMKAGVTPFLSSVSVGVAHVDEMSKRVTALSGINLDGIQTKTGESGSPEEKINEVFEFRRELLAMLDKRGIMSKEESAEYAPSILPVAVDIRIGEKLQQVGQLTQNVVDLVMKREVPEAYIAPEAQKEIAKARLKEVQKK